MNSFTIILENYKNLLLYLLVIFIFNITFLFFPLVNVFGFEFSLVNSVLLFFVSGIYIINYFTKRTSLIELDKSEIKKTAFAFLIFLIVPLLVSLAHSFFTMFCSIEDGFLFYLVITFPSVILGTSTGLLTFTYFKKFRVFIFVIITILILVIPLFEFYYNPQIFFFNPVFGFFPGTIYDEGIKVSTKLILYRTLNLIFFGSIILLILKNINKKFSKLFIGIYVIVVSSLFVYLSIIL